MSSAVGGLAGGVLKSSGPGGKETGTAMHRLD